MKHHLAAARGVMALALLALALLALAEPAAARGFSFTKKDIKTEEALWRLYDRWGKHFGVARSSKEKLRRFAAFNITVQQVVEAGQTGRGLNVFADITDEEFNRDYTCSLTTPPPNFSASPVGRRGGNSTLAILPESVDWRDRICQGRPCLGPVMNQRGCGACWAFAATGAMESNYAIAFNNYLPHLSVQELLDCVPSQRCQGGLAVNAFRWVTDHHGLASSTSYPYRAANGTCHASTTPNVLFRMRGFEAVERSDELDEASLLWAVNYGPVVVTIAVGNETNNNFRGYQGGLYSKECGPTPNHELLLVGYDSDCYILKNSWGSGWGEDGYLLLPRDLDCGILKRNSYYPLMS